MRDFLTLVESPRSILLIVRRKAEKLILENRVKVNGIIVNQLGSSVDSKDIITIDDNSNIVICFI